MIINLKYTQWIRNKNAAAQLKTVDRRQLILELCLQSPRWGISLNMYLDITNEVSRSKLSKVKARTGQTDRRDWTYYNVSRRIRGCGLRRSVKGRAASGKKNQYSFIKSGWQKCRYGTLSPSSPPSMIALLQKFSDNQVCNYCEFLWSLMAVRHTDMVGYFPGNSAVWFQHKSTSARMAYHYQPRSNPYRPNCSPSQMSFI